jgi:2,5-diketo-D-gluconate reductase A
MVNLMTAVPNIKMNDGFEIPQLGYGVFQIDPAVTKEATLAALDVGYRHVDTAQMYGNEQGVGEAIRESGLGRAEIFVTSKLNNTFHEPADARRAFGRTMEVLGLEHLDLFLIHWPLPEVGDFVNTWRAMEEMHATGRVRSIGVSNFQVHHLERLLGETETVPAVNQIEIHPYLIQEELRRFHREHGIVTEAWSPLAKGHVVNDPVISEIGARVGRSPAQVTLRWHIQRGDVVFPKSVTRSRIEENFNLFDFELTQSDIDAISALDRHERTGPDPDLFNRIS